MKSEGKHCSRKIQKFLSNFFGGLRLFVCVVVCQTFISIYGKGLKGLWAEEADKDGRLHIWKVWSPQKKEWQTKLAVSGLQNGDSRS